MRQLSVLLLLFSFISGCRQSSASNSRLEQRIDSLEKKLATVYKPGFGEFMSSIQAHHNKLWFAGRQQNWKLCDFELHEIGEAVEAIKQYETERPESQKISMLQAPLDSLAAAIEKKDGQLFKNGFVLLTATCNNCHHATEFEFNKVIIPESSPFTNQDFGGTAQ